MIHIRRGSGHPLEQWTFDERWLRSADPLRLPLLYEGFELEEWDGLDFRIWQFDGRELRAQSGSGPTWLLENGQLTQQSLDSGSAWAFDGRVLEQLALPAADRWEASAEVPLLVMAYVAGLL